MPFTRIWILTCLILSPITSILVRLRHIYFIMQDQLLINYKDATSQIVYSSSFSLTDPSTVDEYSVTNDTALVPIPAEEQYDPASVTIPLVVVFDTATDGTNRAYFNETTYNTPNVATVFSAFSLDEVAGEGASLVAGAYGPWNFVLDANETVDIVVMNSDAGKHPL